MVGCSFSLGLPSPKMWCQEGCAHALLGVVEMALCGLMEFKFTSIPLAARAPMYLLSRVCPSLIREVSCIILGMDLVLLLLWQLCGYHGAAHFLWLNFRQQIMLKFIVSCHT